MPQILEQTAIAYNVLQEGSVQRLLAEKVAEVVSVKDFGAVGDGIADDTQEIQAALTWVAANGGALTFPPGQYVVSNINCTLGADVCLLGHCATLKALTNDAIMADITVNGYDISLQGITFDGNTRARIGLKISSVTQSDSVVNIVQCAFKNTFQTFPQGNFGLFVNGGFSSVALSRCQFKNHTRTPGIGPPGSNGTSGCSIVHYNGMYSNSVHVSHCDFEDISNGETALSPTNADADGLQVFSVMGPGGYQVSSATIDGCTFRNCKGRCVKIQADRASVVGCHVYRNVSGIGTLIDEPSSELDFQVTAGQVSDCTFHYEDEVAGEETFVRPVYAVSFYNGEDHGRDRTYNVSGCQVFVDTTVGALEAFCTLTDALGTLEDNKVVNVSDVSVSGTVDHFIDWPGTSQAFSGKSIVRVKNCSAKKILTSMCAVNTLVGENNNFLTVDGFANFGPVVPAHHDVQSEPAPFTYSAITCNLANTFGILLERDALLVSPDPSSATERGFISHGIGCRAVSGSVSADTPTKTSLRSYSSTIVHNSTEKFPFFSYFDIGLVLIHVNWNKNGVALVAYDASGIDVIYESGSSIFAFGDTSNPGIAGKMNVWVAFGGNLKFRNKLGDARVVTATILG